MQKETDNWYASWFNTPYYHILYKDRDHTEAAAFMNTLTKQARKFSTLHVERGVMPDT